MRVLVRVVAIVVGAVGLLARVVLLLPRGGAERKQYPGQYGSSTDTFACAFLLPAPAPAPAHGKMTTPGMSYRWVGDTARG